jgi:hypothetical protein
MANLTKRIVEGLQAQDRAYDLRDSILRGFLIRVEPGGYAAASAINTTRGTARRPEIETATNHRCRPCAAGNAISFKLLKADRRRRSSIAFPSAFNDS